MIAIGPYMMPKPIAKKAQTTETSPTTETAKPKNPTIEDVLAKLDQMPGIDAARLRAALLDLGSLQGDVNKVIMDYFQKCKENWDRADKKMIKEAKEKARQELTALIKHREREIALMTPAQRGKLNDAIEGLKKILALDEPNVGDSQTAETQDTGSGLSPDIFGGP